MILTQVASVKYMIACLECLNELCTELRKVSAILIVKVHVSKIRL